MCCVAISGMAPSTKGSVVYSSEGFEVTIGTNHLGHFLLANLLLKVRSECRANIENSVNNDTTVKEIAYIKAQSCSK